MKFGSVCSGIEAASVAWHPLGWEAAWLSEIEPFPCAVLKHHYPDVPNLGDMTKFKEWKIESNIDVFVGGTPCQSFSVAGLRKGLDDPRGNLMLTYLAIAKQHRPRWLVWENVPGVLSSADGRDFGSFLGGLAICGYGFAYRVLDAQYFGVAQRRKRVFVVGYLGDWRPAAAVLFERHSLQGHPAPSREKRQAVTQSIRSSSDGSSWPADISSTLNASFGTKQGLENQHINANCPMFVPSPTYGGSDANVSDTVTSKWAKGSGGPSGSECGLFVAQPIVIDRAAFNQGENAQYKFRAEASETMDCLVAKGPHAVLQPIPIHDQATRHAGRNGDKTMGKGNGLGIGQPGEPMNTLTKGDRHAVAQLIPFDTTQITSPQNGNNPKSGDPCHPLAAGAHPPAVAYNIAPGKGKLKDDIHVTDAHIAKTIDASGSNPAMHQGGAAIVQPITFSGQMSNPQTDMEMTPTLQAKNPMAVCLGGQHPNAGIGIDQSPTLTNAMGAGGGHVPITNATVFGADLSQKAEGIGYKPEQAPCLSVGTHPGHGAHVHAISMAVRRLTPVECERLQGFPDGYTDIKLKNKPTPDGPRYKALGNSMAVPVMAWIGKRIQEVENIK
jgi:DNA (cytosine-5)-methyltransferase 1